MEKLIVGNCGLCSVPTSHLTAIWVPGNQLTITFVTSHSHVDSDKQNAHLTHPCSSSPTHVMPLMHSCTSFLYLPHAPSLHTLPDLLMHTTCILAYPSQLASPCIPLLLYLVAATYLLTLQISIAK